MRKALQVAREATATGDVPVGAVVMDPFGEIVGTGNNRREVDSDPTAHAAMPKSLHFEKRQSLKVLDGYTLVVTLEPCAMCAGAISQARIKTVVFGAWDEKAGAVGSVWDVLRDPRSPFRVEVVSGIMQEECAALLTEFFQGVRK